MEPMEEIPFRGIAAYSVRGITKTSYYYGHYDEATGVLEPVGQTGTRSEAINGGRYLARSMGMSFIWLSEEQTEKKND